MTRRVLIRLSAILFAGGVGVVATASQAGASSEFTVLNHKTNVEFVTATGASLVRPGAFVPGDRIVLRDDLSENGVLVGYSNSVCTVTFNDNVLCDLILAFANTGDIHATALLRGSVGPSGPPTVFDATVDGGTFAYHTAHGSAHVVTQANGDQLVTFSLD